MGSQTCSKRRKFKVEAKEYKFSFFGTCLQKVGREIHVQYADPKEPYSIV